jgi:hypothetical protein
MVDANNYPSEQRPLAGDPDRARRTLRQAQGRLWGTRDATKRNTEILTRSAPASKAGRGPRFGSE